MKDKILRLKYLNEKVHQHRLLFGHTREDYVNEIEEILNYIKRIKKLERITK